VIAFGQPVESLGTYRVSRRSAHTRWHTSSNLIEPELGVSHRRNAPAVAWLAERASAQRLRSSRVPLRPWQPPLTRQNGWYRRRILVILGELPSSPGIPHQLMPGEAISRRRRPPSLEELNGIARLFCGIDCVKCRPLLTVLA
jgi:hypothetical protein